ncbi:GntR family transcriptional regulator [Nocardia miyunensis]|uniref:GntR family transcriptional regulator n=1 Tax=Nocardia miyunensis TaxID=282684 RepID=UPI000A048CAF|nr:GntR family transcriptional regulator [Nocardia miyunensis]
MSAKQLRPLAARPDNLTSMVFEEIRDSIVDATIAPGSRVSEASLASQLKVSKTPVREALLRLRHIGLVEPTQRGLQVISPSVKAIRDAYEFRAGIEGVAGRYAANRASTEEHENIVLLAEHSLAYAESHDAESFRHYDREFHSAIAAASRNENLRQAVQDSLVLTSALRERDAQTSGDSVACAREHVSVAEAIRAGNPERAGSTLNEHILHVMSLVLSSKPGVNTAGLRVNLVDTGVSTNIV